MKKYLVTYTMLFDDGHEGKRSRFFTCDDLEAEWKAFQSLTVTKMRIDTVTQL